MNGAPDPGLSDVVVINSGTCSIVELLCRTDGLALTGSLILQQMSEKTCVLVSDPVAECGNMKEDAELQPHPQTCLTSLKLVGSAELETGPNLLSTVWTTGAQT